MDNRNEELRNSYIHIYHNKISMYHYSIFIMGMISLITSMFGLMYGLAYLAILVVVGILYFNYKAGHITKSEKRLDNIRQCHLLPFVIVLIMVYFVTVIARTNSDFPMGLAEKFLVLAVVSYSFYSYQSTIFFYNKNMVFTTNVSVESATMTRFEKNFKVALKRIAIISALLFLSLFTVVSIDERKVILISNMEKNEEEEEDNKDVKKREVEKFKEIVRERTQEKEDTDNSMARKIIYIVAIVFIVICAVVGLFVFGYLILKRIFAIRLPQIEKFEKIMKHEIVGDDEFIPLRRQESGEIKDNRSNRTKIRKAFAKAVLKRKEDRQKTSYTPGELSSIYLEGDEAKRAKAVRAYDKARYSSLDCSDEDVENVQRMI